MTWFFYSLLSIVALAAAELIQQHILNSKTEIEEHTSAVLTFFTQALLTIPLIIFSDLRFSFLQIFSPITLPLLILVALTASFAMIYYLRSFKVKNISFSTIFVSFSVVVSTTLGVFIFNESFYFYKILGILMVLIAIVSVNIKNAHLEKNHLYGLAAGVLFGVTYTIDKGIVQSIHPIIYMFWAFTLVSLFGFLAKPQVVVNALKKSTINDLKPILFSSIGYFLYNYFTFKAYTVGGEVGRIDTINNSQVFVIILVEYFIFKHTQGIKRKLATALLAFTGVMILGFL